MSGTKWGQNDHLTLPPHLIAPLPGRFGPAIRATDTTVYPPFKTCRRMISDGEFVTITPDDMEASGFSRTCMPLVGFDLLAGD